MTSPPPSFPSRWRFDHSYAKLPEKLFVRQCPAPVSSPSLVAFNVSLARELGVEEEINALPVFAGNALPAGADPLAQAYAGHQFGHFTMLGDGRALLLGEHLTPQGRRVDIQLKGAGPTVFSRNGDGRAALGPMLRELIVGEALHSLGIPTTRGLAVVATGDPVYRETALHGAVLTRVAASHIRVGTFEYAARFTDLPTLSALATYTLQRHYPEHLEKSNPVEALLDAVIEAQAALVARWMLVGFIHGVMNTDNMALSGESLDFGPCAFMDVYDPATVFSSIDRLGRYAYANQPTIARWNLARFAETLLPLLHANPNTALEMAQTALDRFSDRFSHHWLAGMRGKLGLFTSEPEDQSLAETFLQNLQETASDYTIAFADLDPEKPPSSPWDRLWQARLSRQPHPPSTVRARLHAHNPFVIPRNHKVEEALAAAAEENLAPLHRLLEVLSKPFDRDTGSDDYRNPPQQKTQPYRTFCGT
jgi:uncharacterized protein YdiU (UPF0061 family)